MSLSPSGRLWRQRQQTNKQGAHRRALLSRKEAGSMSECTRYEMDTRELRRELREWKALLLADIRKEVTEDIEVLIDLAEDRIASGSIGRVVKGDRPARARSPADAQQHRGVIA